MTDYKNLIDGKMVDNGQWLEVLNPATEQVVGRVPSCGKEELDSAVAAARRAFTQWKKTTAEERQQVVQGIAAAIKENADELYRLLTSEQGKPHAQAQQEIYGAAGLAAAQSTLTLDDVINQDDDTRLSRTRRVPVGVVGGIVPWNFPIMMAIQKIVPALVAGCTIVLKPSPFTPLTTLRVAELIKDVVPAGTVNIITGEDTLGPLITEHPDIDKITFTGSTATGKKIMEGASGDLKRITLELGGNDASIVLPDADVQKVAEQLFWSSFSNAGQVCIAAKRIYIHEDIYDDLSKAIADYAKTVVVGDGSQQGTGVGPIQNKKQYERVLDLIQDAKDNGYKFLTGGDKDPSGTGYYVPITILDNPPEDARIVAEEQFGPVMPLMKFASVDEVIERANNSEYGLAGAVWTKDTDKGVEIAEQLETGTVWINEFMQLSPFAPFGGHKQSGFGAEYGIDGLKEFTYPQVITVKRDAAV
ncbi:MULTISPECIES: aldehyde dehydrogenase family protein [Erythrobacteraceae]|jgi:aldehyde dehydrogenase (NAD+)|uniref:aldehyde dehydrogenase family protein n=2 Tax=Sphingomonadales TaxID=204457 RepID=UPI0007BA72C6|nr:MULTISPECIES: aldehyde dehydrogenase family protein [unclassified Erythrobacter]MBN91885.1 aldehyde dehydrogenase [Erythrobacteraceae bacterium]RZP17144.1 MAG: aldehyde dehydrogenase family protein [Erythrobacter sp.]KZY08988.1 aldehyde dehydrogenase [Erythrobacter sp. HI0028]KZY90658.1 aldehyde dehydrogenase [Erythrobacter sp. HI0074]KZZ06909.1 aldehyde dehydrogenase [Erythrobacter sp. HI0077]|tara:strand:- start:136 stop:1557 length:1422 start_codon:yes stop_codon:yes gene_type:complete